MDAVSAAQGASEAGAEGAEGPEASTGGCEPTEAAWRARETRERRSWGGGTGGQHLVAKPVTSPDSARATEPRRPEAVLELRRGARLGSGAGERERVRAREEAMTLLPMPRFWAKLLLIWRDITVKDFCPQNGRRRKEARHMIPCVTQPDSPSNTLSGKTRLIS